MLTLPMYSYCWWCCRCFFFFLIHFHWRYTLFITLSSAISSLCWTMYFKCEIQIFVERKKQGIPLNALQMYSSFAHVPRKHANFDGLLTVKASRYFIKLNTISVVINRLSWNVVSRMVAATGNESDQLNWAEEGKKSSCIQDFSTQNDRKHRHIIAFYYIVYENCISSAYFKFQAEIGFDFSVTGDDL